ncbi:ABC transporter ATP-binding protein [Mastigocladopsis repens]|uniref:ABC transporter ATP-binding protein n=1 Tax=Mastigocladopsis repens TaxID=221287 RepID=UPI0003062622|nr:ABC transporter ATP-binding protein [Mastigocladopsis repens]
MPQEYEQMDDSNIPSDDAKSGYQMSSTATGAIVAEGVEMVIHSKQQRLHILKEIDWEIQKGDIEILMGPSGSGKTTLLTILAGLLTPTAGSVYLLGQEITRMSRTQLARFRRHQIGFIFQDFNLFPAMTAIENVEAALNVKGIRGKLARKEAQALLEQVEIGDKAKQLPRDLSGGQKQRVAIARALTGHPQLILADEPTAALDSHSGHVVMQLLRQLAKEQGCTVLIVTHDPRILDLADRVAYMEDGVLKY